VDYDGGIYVYVTPPVVVEVNLQWEDGNFGNDTQKVELLYRTVPEWKSTLRQRPEATA
jgi:hypothetical protein